MKFIIGTVECEITLITRIHTTTWIGLLINSDVRCVDCVICFTEKSRFVYLADGMHPAGYRNILLLRAIDYILLHDILVSL